MSKVGRMADADMSTMTVQSWVEVSCITIHSPVYFGFPIIFFLFKYGANPCAQSWVIHVHFSFQDCNLPFVTVSDCGSLLCEMAHGTRCE